MLSDNLGSTSTTAAADGSLLDTAKYTAFGEIRDGATATDYRYTGQRDEFEIGLYYYVARYYDPYLNHWIQPDTIIPDLYNPQCWNRYSYVNGNPITYNDPTGHCISCLIIAGIIIDIAIYNNFIRTPSAPADGNASIITDLVSLGYDHAEHANIIGEGLQDLQDDPSVQHAQASLLEQIKDDPRYGQESYKPDIDYQVMFNAVGPSGSWKQAALENNQAFWMVHNGTLSASNTSVTKDGVISTTWKVTDSFDFIPDFKKRDFEYNLFAVPTYFAYNIIFGAKKQFPINASWKETISPKIPLSIDK